MRVESFDHVALWVSDPDPVAELLLDAVPGLREIERTDAFVLVGADAREGKITLFGAEGPRDPGALESVTLRVPSLAAPRERLAARQVETAEVGGRLRFPAPDGLTLELTESDGPVDLAGVTVAVADPAAATDQLVRLGFTEQDGRLVLAGRTVDLVAHPVDPVERPLLNHLALRVASLDDAQAHVLMGGFVVEREVDAANTRAVFVRGPEGISIEIVEHKPSFALV